MTPKQEAALRLALEALKGGLWDYGPGQDEHERCNEVIAICEEALADSALDKMADNARELGLDYEPSANVAAVNTSSERVDKTAKNVHEQPARQREPVRKVYICTSCEGVYADAPVTKCDCMPDKDEFTEGFIYTSTPAPKPWVGLTDEEMGDFKGGYQSGRIGSFVGLLAAIEAKLREKNA